MDQVVLMGVVQTSGKLDRDVKKPLPYFLPCSVIKRPVLDMALETPFRHPLRKDSRDTLDLTNVVARDNVRVQAEIDPVIAFIDKALLLCFRAESLRMGPFHGKVHIPAGVVHAPDSAHAASDRIGLHAVNAQQHVTGTGISLIGHMHHVDAGHNVTFCCATFCPVIFPLAALCILPGRHCSAFFILPGGPCCAFRILPARRCAAFFILPGRLFWCFSALSFTFGLFVNFVLLLQVS